MITFREILLGREVRIMVEHPANLSVREAFVLDDRKKMRVLHVDDDSPFLKVAKQCLEIGGEFEIDTASSVDEAFEKMRTKAYDAVVSDYQMPDKDGLDFLKELRQSGNTVPFIMFTGKGREEVAVRALNLGANQYLNKTGESGTVFIELAHSITEVVRSSRALPEGKRSEETARESERKYHSLYCAMNEGVCFHEIIYDQSGKAVDYVLTDANPAFEKITGIRREEAIGCRASKLYGTSEPPYIDVYSKVAASGEPTSFETYFPPMKKHFSISVFSLAKGMFATVFCDFTERRKTEDELRTCVQRYECFFQATGELEWTTNAEGEIVEDLLSFRRFTGQTFEEIKGWNWARALHPDDVERSARTWRDALESKSKYEVEYRLRRHDGVYRRFLARGVPLLNEDGSIKEWVGSCTDITDVKKAEQESAETQRKFAALFDGNPEATVYLDDSFHILDINSRFSSLFGYSANEVRGKKLDEIVVPPRLVEEGKTLDMKAADGYVYHDTVRMRKDGSLIPVSVSAAPISIQGCLVGFIGVYKDISGQKSAERKLAIMNEKLRVIGGLTRHDVRNKLSIITANAYLIKKKLQDRPEAIERFRDIESACDMILRIFDFARDYERLGVEELTYVDVEDCAQKAASLFSNIDGTTINIECHGVTVFADSLLRQLFYNLIDNSLKYGEHVTPIKIRHEKSSEQLKLIYEDNGVGISAEGKSAIFNEGYTTGKGSGYGLYFIKKMMEVYGWTINESGTPGKGVQFVLTIPRINNQGRENYRTTEQKSETT